MQLFFSVKGCHHRSQIAWSWFQSCYGVVLLWLSWSRDFGLISITVYSQELYCYGRPYDSTDWPLCFAADVFFLFFETYLQHPSADCHRLSHILVSECNLRNWVRNLGSLLCAPKRANSAPILDSFPNWWLITSEWNKISSIGKVGGLILCSLVH